MHDWLAADPPEWDWPPRPHVALETVALGIAAAAPAAAAAIVGKVVADG